MQTEDPGAIPRNNFENPRRQVVLALGLNDVGQREDWEPFRWVAAKNLEQVVQTLEQEDVVALLLGPNVALPEVLESLGDSKAQAAELAAAAKTLELSAPAKTRIIVLEAGSKADLLQKFVDAGQVFYLARGRVQPAELRKLIAGGMRHAESMGKWKRELQGFDDERAGSVLDLFSRLPLQTDLASAGRLLAETGRDLLQARIAECFLYDPEAETLTPAAASETEKWTYSAASGLVAYVARTGERICLEDVSADARYDSDIDAPAEMRGARFVAEPIMGSDGSAAAVLAAVRGGKDAAFGADDVRMMKLLATWAAPTFNQVLLQNQAQEMLTKRASGSEATAGIFRQEALDYHVRNWDQQGDVLRVVPNWLRTGFWVVVALFAASVIALGFLTRGFGTLLAR